MWGVVRQKKGTDNSLRAIKSCRAARPDGERIYVILDNLSAHKAARDKANLDVTWLRDDSLDDASAPPAPGVLAAEIVEELEAALAQFSELAASLPVEVSEE